MSTVHFPLWETSLWHVCIYAQFPLWETSLWYVYCTLPSVGDLPTHFPLWDVYCTLPSVGYLPEACLYTVHFPPWETSLWHVYIYCPVGDLPVACLLHASLGGRPPCGMSTAHFPLWETSQWHVYCPLPSVGDITCLLYTSPSPRDGLKSRMPSSA